MRTTGLIALGTFCLTWFAVAAVGQDLAVDDQQPVMISLADREAPSDEEWDALHEDTQRAGLFGSLGDLKSQTISFMDTQYFTANCAEGTLAAFGKMEKNRFDRYGHIAHVEFDVPRNTWKERYALNAAALVKLTGKARFVEFAGVELDTAVQDRRQIEVTFVGTMVPKDEAIRRLNADVEALTYLAAIHDKHQQQAKGFKLFGKSAAPKPKVVLANVVMFDGKSSQMLEGNLHGKAESVLHGLGGELKLVKSGGEEITLLTPVVRCYRTYSIEFHTDANGQLATTLRTDRTGRQHRVPTVFDLTPDL
jgi:hypothetical protein